MTIKMKRLGVTILLTALVLITGAGLLLAGDTEDQARKELISEHYEHGLACYRQKDYFQAKVEFDKVLVLDPGHKKAKRYSGLALKKAEQYIGRAVEPKTQLSGYLYELGKGYYLLGQYQEAVQKFKQVLLVNPSHEGAQVYLGQIKGQKSLEEIVNKEIAVRQQTKLGVRRRGVGTKDSRQIEKKTEIKVKQDKKAEKGPEKLAKKKAKQEAKEAKKSEKLAKKKAKQEKKAAKKEAKEAEKKIKQAKKKEKEKEKQREKLAKEIAKAEKLRDAAEEKLLMERVEGCYLEGRDCYKARQYGEAIKLFQKTIKLKPDYTKASRYLKKARKKWEKQKEKESKKKLD